MTAKKQASPTTRQEKLLNLLVQEYVALAEPLSSKFLCKKYDFGICPSSLRIEMQKLTDMGYLEQPHTSAGRIPTIEGYKEYLAIFVDNGEITKAERAALDKIAAFDLRQKIKEVAKVVADLANNAVFVGFGKDDYFWYPRPSHSKNITTYRLVFVHNNTQYASVASGSVGQVTDLRNHLSTFGFPIRDDNAPGA